MESLAQSIAPMMRQSAPRSTTASSIDLRDQRERERRGRKLAQRVWDDMAALYGAKWSKRMGPTPSAMWCKALESIDGQTVQSVFFLLGDDRSPWPPTALVDFMALVDRVLARRFGLPAADDALAMARAGDWSVPAVYEIACRIGLGRVMGSGVRPADESKAFAEAWQKHWREVVGEVQAGRSGRFRQPPSAVAALPKPSPLTTEEKHAMRERHGLDALRKRLGGVR